MLRKIAHVLSIPVIWLMMPVKLVAFRWRHRVIGRALLEMTSFCDFLLIFANVQNEALLLHFRVYRGAFIFGKSVMVVDHAVAAREIAQPSLRGNRFMGVDIVSNDPGVFATNAGAICTGQPTRQLIRNYIDEKVLTPPLRAICYQDLVEETAEVLHDWALDPNMMTMRVVRGTLTRMFIQVLSGKLIPKEVAYRVTWSYLRRFTEFSLFGRYCPAMLGLLGTREGIRRDAFIPLRKLGVDNMVIDMTLFAGMFSVGTIVLKSLDLSKQHRVDYRELSLAGRFDFVVEALRLCPTVSTVHRIVEDEETVKVRGRRYTLRPGDEVAYPFACINRDREVFQAPDILWTHRPLKELDQVLSWSAGANACPARDLSIVSAVVMLDVLSAHEDLRTLRIFNLEF